MPKRLEKISINPESVMVKGREMRRKKEKKGFISG